MSLSFDQVMQLIQVVLLPLLGVLINEIRKLRESVQDLRTDVAVASTRIMHIEADHGRRIIVLEGKQ